jgi:hypothetical protein
VLDPITHYYGRIANPARADVRHADHHAALVGDPITRRLMASHPRPDGLSMMTGTLKVIPTAQRLGAGTDPEDVRPNGHSMLPFHLILMVNIIALTRFNSASRACELLKLELREHF